jgi:hypothetical protein
MQTRAESCGYYEATMARVSRQAAVRALSGVAVRTAVANQVQQGTMPPTLRARSSGHSCCGGTKRIVQATALDV